MLALSQDRHKLDTSIHGAWLLAQKSAHHMGSFQGNGAVSATLVLLLFKDQLEKKKQPTPLKFRLARAA